MVYFSVFDLKFLDISKLVQYFIMYLCLYHVQKALYHLESDNIFHITVVIADWLGWNPYRRSSFFTVSDWIILF